MKVNPTKRSTKILSLRTGFVAGLRAFLHVEGTSAPSPAPRYALLVLATLATTLGVLAFSGAPAFAAKRYIEDAPSSFGIVGEGTVNGELTEPDGVAVNEVTLGDLGDVYVIDRDRGNYSIAYFSSAGVELGRFEAPPGGFGSLLGIAVDNSTNPLDTSAGDVYVADWEHKVIDKFSSTGMFLGQLTETTGGSPLTGPEHVAVDPSGDLWVYELESAGPNGIVNEFADTGVFVKAFKTEHAVGRGITVDSTGNVYVTSGRVLKFEGATGTKLAEFGEEAHGLAIDPATQNLLVDEAKAIALYGPNPGSSSTPIETFPSTGFQEVLSIAVNGADTVYAGVRETTGNPIRVFDYHLFPDVIVQAASSVTQTTATLGGTVNPDEAEASSPGEAALTGCRFEYGTEAGSFTNTAQCSPAAASITGEQHVSADLGGLEGGTVYHYRLSATNTIGDTEHSQELEFLTTGSEISGESVSDVASTSATLDAQINPREAPTTYYFQYSAASTAGCTTSPASCADVPAAPGVAIGSGDSAVQVSQQAQGLQPSTVYHYRVVAVSEPRPGRFKTNEGADHTFTTQGPGGTLTLPDGRAWELVSPAQKLGAQVIRADNALIQASEVGGAISYPMTAPFVANPAGNVRLTQAISTRGPDGWTTEDIATPYTKPTKIGSTYGEYKFFSSDLSRGLVVPFGVEPTPLPPFDEETTEGTAYLRNNTECEPTLTEAIPATCYLHLGARFVTATPDLSHVVLGCGSGYCEWSAGALLPVGEPGTKDNMRRAISNDGSRIAGGPGYQIASSDGSLVFRTSGGGLYVENLEAGESKLITVPLNGGEEPAVQGLVLGASEDGSYVYLVAKGVLSETANAEQEKAVAGGDNLYVLHRQVNGSAEAWTPSFIATLSAGNSISAPATGDAPDWEASNFYPGTQTVEVSPDGHYLAFMSDRPLTGYDNRDASSGEPDEEVYRFHDEPGVPAGGSLVCASCNPTDARPAGWLEPHGVSSDIADVGMGAWVGRWVAATIPGMTEIGLREGIENSFEMAALYESRYMLNSGRLFFDSHDALVPQDVNGVGDVYEYESGGTASCPAASSGCVALLSGGTGPRESAFADASTNGNDIFFVTADKLIPQDLGNEYDMYDAHVCSAEAPCPASVVTPPPCTTADSCKPAQAAQPGVFGPSGSATFNGPGNPPPPAPAVVKPVVKSLTNAQKLAKALKACKQKPKKKRASCQKQAKKRYGASKAKKSAKGRK
jgi:hypothetical protein